MLVERHRSRLLYLEEFGRRRLAAQQYLRDQAMLRSLSGDGSIGGEAAVDSSSLASQDEPSPSGVELDTSTAHPARLYNYLVGGKDNYEVDRQAAERAYKDYPGGVPGVRRDAIAQRRFLARTVRELATAGIRQFLDIGTGIPTENNTHEVAQRVAPESRVVYVDNDPIVLVHARALLRSTPEGKTAYIDANLRDPDTILTKASETLDFDQPVAVTMLGILHFIESEVAYGCTKRFVDAISPGSYLVVAHLAADVLPEMVEACRLMSQDFPVSVIPRTRDEVAGFFDGLEIVEPGVVQAQQWRPDADNSDDPDQVPVNVGVARKN
jgi:O-methyltransferase involved in polyketide biosynthesis